MLGLDGNAPATGGQGFSFKTPKNCILDNISIVNTRGFQVLWYADRDNNQAYSNYLIDVRTDGASLTSAGLLFANLYASYMVRPYVRGIVKQPDTTGYAIDIKNRCVDCGVIDFLTEDCYLGMVISDDRSGIPEGEDLRGKGAQNTRITGTANRCKSAFSTNLAIGTTASIQAVSCGSASTEENIAAITIAGFNRFCNYDLHIREVHADAPVIRNGSEYQVFNIQFYDNSGTPLYLGLAGSYYSEINVMGGPNRSSGLFNMWSKITPFDIEDARTIPRYLDMRDVPSPIYASGVWRSALNFLLPGGSRGANQFSVRDNGNIYMQTLGTPRLSYRQSSNSWVFDNGVPAAADDAAAAAAGIPVNGIYQTGGVLKVRIT
ncbi:hypothetical protein [Bordetella genomosp. 4]|uniref:Uncharacterized protein n=1 Tax=Bordetella genomosp. 4 TaxID=463044 RepID=A0A261U339_9BORD|nr:hypothetical protein [Bordetella genomosp. 4]OZI56378.1 hypothetical protein CAL20_13150 [Bordetella genomosp. 4]